MDVNELQSLVARIEHLEEEKRSYAKDIREVYDEAKFKGFDIKALKEIVRLRRLSQADRDERDNVLALYKQALGMLDGTPLGEAALRRAAGDRGVKPSQRQDTSRLALVQ